MKLSFLSSLLSILAILILVLLIVASCKAFHSQTTNPTITSQSLTGDLTTNNPTLTAKPNIVLATIPFTLAVEPVADTVLGVTCVPPCWLDIWPGITIKQKARAILERYSKEGIVIDWLEMDWKDCPEITVWPIDINPHFTDAILVFSAESDTVYRIDVAPYPFYTLGKLVDSYGPPELVSNYGPVFCSDCRVAMSGWTLGEKVREMISLRAYYPTKGMTFGMEAPISMEGCMCPDMVVSAGFYYSPMDLDEFKNARFSSDSCDIFLREGIFANESIIEWHGFGPGY